MKHRIKQLRAHAHGRISKLREKLKARLAKIRAGLHRAVAAIKRRAQRKGPTTMFDDTTVALIPSDAPAAAGYVGGLYPTFHLLRAQCPKAVLLSVAINSAENAQCLDVEPGDATNTDAAAWYQRQRQRGEKLIAFYTSVSNAQALVDTLTRAGIKRSAYKLWTAHYTGHAHICGKSCGYPAVRADGTQWTDKALGRSLDQSLLLPTFFGG